MCFDLAKQFFENLGHKTIILLEHSNRLGPVGVMRSPTPEEEREIFVPRIKQFRKEVDGLIRRASRRNYNDESDGKEIVPNAFETQEAVTQVRIHLTSAKMWAGKILESLGNPFPADLADKAEQKDEAK
jgi:hypothetical protein